MTFLAVTPLDRLNTTRQSSPTTGYVLVSTNQGLYQDHDQVMTFPSSTQVTCVGHIIGAMVADTQLHAQRAAKAVRIQYEELQPVVTIQVRPPAAAPTATTAFTAVITASTTTFTVGITSSTTASHTLSTASTAGSHIVSTEYYYSPSTTTSSIVSILYYYCVYCNY